MIGNDILYSDARSSTLATSPMKENELLENFEEISIGANLSPDKTRDQSDDETSSSVLVELSHSLGKCEEM